MSYCCSCVENNKSSSCLMLAGAALKESFTSNLVSEFIKTKKRERSWLSLINNNFEMLEAQWFQRVHWHYGNKTLFMNKWSHCTPLKRMNYWWLLAFNIFWACANHIWMPLVHPHTHSRETIHQAILQHTRNNCILCHLPKGGAMRLFATQLDKAELSCIYQQEGLG